MKVLFLITSLRGGGAERVMSILVNHFAHSDIEPHLVLFEGGEVFYNIDSRVKLFVLTRKKLFDNKIGTFIQQIQLFFALIKLIRKNKYDCLVSFTTYVNAITIILGKLLNTTTIISERHDPQNYNVGFSHSLFRKLTYKYASAIVLQTESSQHSFLSQGIKLPQRKNIIQNPILGYFTPDNSIERKDIILSVGRLSQEKGHDRLIEAFAKTTVNWDLWIIGKGPQLESLVAQSIALDIAHKVKFLGEQSDLKKYYSAAKVFVLPSRTEGFPNVLCEAMISGCACISFDCPSGPSEIIQHRDNGILVENGNVDAMAKEIQQLCSDERQISALSDKGKELKGKLNTQTIGKQWEYLIQDVVNKSNKL